MLKLLGAGRAGNKDRILSLVAALAVFVSLSMPADAAGGPWTIVSVDGAAKIVAGAGAAQQPVVGQPITAGIVIETGADGTVVLARRGDSIFVTPNSRMSIPAGLGGKEPGVLQSLGKLLFRMESRESRDFEITTPYLAAAIKGTTFTVEVDDHAASVNVEEGLVQVTATVSGDMAFVGAGERAEVDRDGPDTVQVGATGDDTQGDEAEEAGEPIETRDSDGSAKSSSNSESDSDSTSGSESGSDGEGGSDSEGGSDGESEDNPSDDGMSSPENPGKDD